MALSNADITARTNIQFSSSGEPFIPFSIPGTSLHFLFTPPHAGDSVFQLESLNDHRVWPNLLQPPFPYTQADADWWNDACTKTCERIVGRWRSGVFGEADECPVSCVRDAESGQWIGQMGITRWGFPNLSGDEKEKAVAENQARTPGDPDVVWSVGYHLHPKYHGKGLATAALRTLIEQFMIPVLNVQQMRAEVFAGNIGSLRAQEKNGFVRIGEYIGPVHPASAVAEGTHWMTEWSLDRFRATSSVRSDQST